MNNWFETLKNFRETMPYDPSDQEDDEALCDDDEPCTVRQTARLDIGIERKGRGGKTATLITGWELDDSELLEIAAQLKKRLATGGSARGGDILIQGDRRNDVLALLTSMGYKARIV